MSEERLTPGWLEALRRAESSEDAEVISVVLPNGCGPMFFRRIRARSFRMGDLYGQPEEQPEHLVKIPKDFYMGIFPVTQRQYAAFRKNWNHFRGPDADGFDPLLRPAENLNWEDACEFCQSMNEDLQAQYPKGYEASLPPEAHWEYACRAGIDTEYGLGDGEAVLREMGWFDGNSHWKTHPVGQKEPNKWDLYDMHGNIGEWCLDVGAALAYRSRLDGDDAVEMPEGIESTRVMRGGSWFDSARGCRSAYRGWGHAGSRFHGQGFRVCLLPGPVVPAAAHGAR